MAAPLTLSALAAYCEPCGCDTCAGLRKFLGEPCSLCAEPRWGCRSMPCWCELGNLCACGQTRDDPAQERCVDCWLADYRQKFRGAVGLQALWRGYISRKQTAERNAEEVRAHEPLWRFYDTTYKMNVLCQQLCVDLKENDPAWDATSTLYYSWMLEHGPMIEEMETYLRRRGWVRPKKTRFNPTVLKQMFNGALDSCGASMEARRVAMAIVDSAFKVKKC